MLQFRAGMSIARELRCSRADGSKKGKQQEEISVCLSLTLSPLFRSAFSDISILPDTAECWGLRVRGSECTESDARQKSPAWWLGRKSKILPLPLYVLGLGIHFLPDIRSESEHGIGERSMYSYEDTDIHRGTPGFRMREKWRQRITRSVLLLPFCPPMAGFCSILLFPSPSWPHKENI